MQNKKFIILSSLIPILMLFNITVFKGILIANILIALILVLISGKLVSEIIKLRNRKI
ncbi:putative membrane protein [[Clostridium] bifermentans ATCC 638]|uniref:Putative membrane protein n=1 Tax=Paraclostridium bifermentans ATCC 638 = DSM 14991 TaxID=1233171 RepID=T4VTG5_PARBF|nr:hypothetical protein [Paraclostridium bifermentans]EQK44056.1 putative membrane protein [[Clostridium] bifermentans ATCC 638] [Paraclostridium bifermentans ATCC 638 = DSM 14991]UAG19796.1 hypothetical protein KXZ80_16665 [Paraclostridium bifermentans]